GTTGVAKITLSLGNLRCTAGYPSCYKGYRAYSSWEAGFLDWYKLILTVYVAQWGLTTVEQIIHVYPPASENDVPAYIIAVKRAVDTWQAQQIPTIGRDVLNGEQSATQTAKVVQPQRSSHSSNSAHSSKKDVATCLQQTSPQTSRCSLSKSKRSRTRSRGNSQWRPMRVAVPPAIQPKELQQPASTTGRFAVNVK